MSARNLLERTVNGTLAKFGYQIMSNSSNTSLRAAFLRLAQRPVTINTVIDVGASDGRWSEKIRPFYAAAFYFLVEANPVHEPALKAYRQAHSPSVDYVLAAAGERAGELFFDNSEPLGGAASATALPTSIRVPVTTLDLQVSQRQLRPPFLIKLDTHGFEIPILKGAAETLKQANLLVIETYNFQIHEESVRFHEMCSFMESLGFRPIDLIEPMHRGHDQALWQFDLVFIRAERPEFQYGGFN